MCDGINQIQPLFGPLDRRRGVGGGAVADQARLPRYAFDVVTGVDEGEPFVDAAEAVGQ